MTEGNGIAPRVVGAGNGVKPTDDISKANEANNLSVTPAALSGAAGPGLRYGSRWRNDQLAGASALTYPLPMLDLRSVQPLDRPIPVFRANRGSLSSVFIPAGRLGTAPQERCF